MNHMKRHQVALLIFMQWYACTCYQTGPPVSDHVCTNMFPEGHLAEAQTSTPPFEIDISQNVYTTFEKIHVTLRVTAKGHYFRGFFIQARSTNCSQTEGLGEFVVAQEDQSLLQTLPCFRRLDSAVAHRTNQNLEKVVFQWNAPVVSIGDLYFRATVVQEKDIFWTTVRSNFLLDISKTVRVPAYCPSQMFKDPPNLNTSSKPTNSTDEKHEVLTTSPTCGCTVNDYCNLLLAFPLIVTFVFHL